MVFGLLYADNNEKHIIKNWILIEENKKGIFEYQKFQKNTNILILVEIKIGLINAALYTTLIIENFNIDILINYGTVGAINNLNFKLFDLVIPKKIYFFDVITPWYKNGQFPNEAAFFKNSLKYLKNAKIVNLGSSTGFEFNENKIKNLKSNFKDLGVFDMESAAIAFVAKKYNKKVYFIKCISDIVGKNNIDVNLININIKKASFIAFEAAMAFIENY